MLVCEHLETKVKCDLLLFFFTRNELHWQCHPVVSAFNTLLAQTSTHHGIRFKSPCEVALSTLLNELIYAQHLKQCLAQKCLKVVMVVGVVTLEEISPSPMRGLRQVSPQRLHPAPDVTPTSTLGGVPLRSPPPLGLSHLAATVPTHGRAPPWVPAGNPGLTQDHIRGIRSVDRPHLKGYLVSLFLWNACF